MKEILRYTLYFLNFLASRTRFQGNEIQSNGVIFILVESIVNKV